MYFLILIFLTILNCSTGKTKCNFISSQSQLNRAQTTHNFQLTYYLKINQYSKSATLNKILTILSFSGFFFGSKNLACDYYESTFRKDRPMTSSFFIRCQMLRNITKTRSQAEYALRFNGITSFIHSCLFMSIRNSKK